MAAIAFVWSGGAPGPPLAVLAGGLLVGLSYWTIGLSVHALTIGMTVTGYDGGGDNEADLAPKTPVNMRWTLARVVLRYALLGLLAYVMIARLHLHPLGL